MQIDFIETETVLEDILSTPSPKVAKFLAEMDGDLIILGVGGKMGPTLAKMAVRASREAGVFRRIIGVSRFSSPGLQEALETAGVETISCDLLEEDSLQQLPEIPNVVFMAGRKFGSTGNESLTWMMNTYLPGRVAQKFRDARIVVFSTGNVYPLTPVAFGGVSETHPTEPIGEYAQSCLGRERMFEYFSEKFGTTVCIIRLNYAIDLRYGVLLDIAQKVWQGQAVELTMGHVNVIWQGDANAYVLRSFALCGSPPEILNVTGPELISVRWLATRFGDIFGREPILKGEESATALLSNTSRCHHLFGYPRISLEQMIQWIAHWVMIDGPSLSKPTHFEQREGKF